MTNLTQVTCPSCGSSNRLPPGRPPAAAKCGRCKKNLTLEAPVDVDDAALGQHLQHTAGPVLVDVWAPWCGPCQTMAPHFSEAARILAGEARLLKLNADTSETVKRLGVSGIPALILFRDGRIIDRKSGLMNAAALTAWVRDRAQTASQ